MFTQFDVVPHLDSEEAIAAYLSAVMEENAPDLLLAALGDVAKARGMATLAHESGINSESLYSTLHPGAKPHFDTVFRIMQALHLRLQVVPPNLSSAG